MGRDITLCHPELQEKAEKLVSACKGYGLLIGIGECFRTVAEQDKLYAQGRTAPGSIVTNAKGSSYSSHHQWGTAFDIYRNDGKGAYNDSDGFFSKVGAIGVKIGLEWGGNWTSPVDKPHFQLPYWGSTTTKLKEQYGTPDNFKKTWSDDMTEAQVEAIAEKVCQKMIAEKAEKVYKWTLEVPEWGRPTVQKLLDKKLLFGDEKGELNITYSMLQMYVVNDRAGLYD